MKFLLSLLMVAVSVVCTAKDVSMPDTGISFVAPDAFKPVSQELIDIRWRKGRAPKWAAGNESGLTTIAYDLKPNDISVAPLSDLMAHFSTTFEHVVPGILWKKKEIIELSGKSWIYFEMTSNAENVDIYNIMLLTSYGKEMLIFNINSTNEEFSKYESDLRHSVKTIKLPPLGKN